jgi:hypothetical protein
VSAKLLNNIFTTMQIRRDMVVSNIVSYVEVMNNKFDHVEALGNAIIFKFLAKDGATVKYHNQEYKNCIITSSMVVNQSAAGMYLLSEIKHTKYYDSTILVKGYIINGPETSYAEDIQAYDSVFPLSYII